MLKVTDRKYECLHEAGHILTTYIVQGHVELVELLDDPNGKARARTRATFDRSHRRSVACGGFAVEYLLFKAGRISDINGDKISEKSFIDASISNASLDKESFFNGNYVESDGCWPADMDNEFMRYAIDNLAPILKSRFHIVEALATAIEENNQLCRAEIEAIVGN